MIIEGKGQVCPKPVRIPIEGTDLQIARDISEKRNAHRGYSFSDSKWKRGSCADPVLIGTIGELALEKYLSSKRIACHIASAELNDGDGGVDFSFAGVKYQVKTSGKDYDPLLVRRVNERGEPLPLVSNRFIFCKWMIGDRLCWIRGWCNRDAIQHGIFDRSPVGDWWNLGVHCASLLPIRELVLLMKQESTHV